MIGTAPACAVAAAHPGSRLEILPRSDHRPWAEEPGRFTAAVTAFLAQALSFGSAPGGRDSQHATVPAGRSARLSAVLR